MSNKMTCEAVLQHLYDYLDGEVNDELMADIDHHLEDCRECFSRAEFEKLLKKRVEKSIEAEEVPEDVQGRIQSLMNRF